jgi:hypothetical protein
MDPPNPRRPMASTFGTLLSSQRTDAHPSRSSDPPGGNFSTLSEPHHQVNFLMIRSAAPQDARPWAARARGWWPRGTARHQAVRSSLRGEDQRYAAAGPSTSRAGVACTTLRPPATPAPGPFPLGGAVITHGPSKERVFGGDLLSHTVSRAVPSALKGLASGFGMEPGVSPSL